MTGKSTMIDVSEMVAEAPSSSQEAINAYKKPINLGNQFAELIKSEAKPAIVIPE
jgi:hypothetical protein